MFQVALTNIGEIATRDIARENHILYGDNTDKMIFENESLYPLVIDPDVELLNLTDSGAIEDLTINSDDQIPAGTSGSIFVGKRQTYGKSRILMKFPNLNLSAISRSSNIVDAKVYLRDLMCESSSMTVYCYRFTGNDWPVANRDLRG